MTGKNYPKEIYRADDIDGGIVVIVSVRKQLEKAYDLGYRDGQQAQGDPLAGWSNLTEAISSGERIDWDALDGLEAKCVHPELGTLTYRLERDNICSSTMPSGWYMNKSANVWKQAVSDSWYGLQGWSLWVKGDLPMRKRTADELDPGTCFRARYTKGDYVHTYSRAQVLQIPGGTYIFCFNGQFTHVVASYNPADVEVLEVYGVGTFEKPKEEA